MKNDVERIDVLAERLTKRLGKPVKILPFLLTESMALMVGDFNWSNWMILQWALIPGPDEWQTFEDNFVRRNS